MGPPASSSPSQRPSSPRGSGRRCAPVRDRRARRRLGAPPGDGERARGGAHRHGIRDPAHPLGRRRTGGDVGVAAAPGVGERARAHRYRPRARSSGSSARSSATTRQTPPTSSTSATSATAWQGRARSERATRATRGHAQRTTKPASTVAAPPADRTPAAASPRRRRRCRIVRRPPGTTADRDHAPKVTTCPHFVRNGEPMQREVANPAEFLNSLLRGRNGRGICLRPASGINQSCVPD